MSPATSLKERLVCSPRPKREARSAGSEDVSSRYWSLKTRAGRVSKRTSPVERRETVKVKGEVEWRARRRSESGEEKTPLRPDAGDEFASRIVNRRGGDGGAGGRGRTVGGISQRRLSASAIRTRSRSSVSKLQAERKTGSKSQLKTSCVDFL